MVEQLQENTEANASFHADRVHIKIFFREMDNISEKENQNKTRRTSKDENSGRLAVQQN
jgi:hypothetical protein